MIEPSFWRTDKHIPEHKSFLRSVISVKLRDHEKPRAAWFSVENQAVEPREEITEDHVGSEKQDVLHESFHFIPVRGKSVHF